MRNDEYRASRGTDHPYTATEAESKAAWLLLTATKRAEKLANIKEFGERRKAWAMPILNLCGEDFNDD